MSLLLLNHEPASEQGLVELLKRKSEEAFEELVDRFGRRLYQVSFRILRNA